ncbi:MAG: hypothetical protein GY869_02760 [Planctomycetes bacterium]|nr:hypothetical protein [Planctomycetota bacterium]
MCKIKVARLIIFAWVGIMISTAIADAADIHIKVVTDKSTYSPGETVYWTIYVSASQADNRGVSLLSVDLHDDQMELLAAPLLGADPNEFLNSEYGVDEDFKIFGAGTVAADDPRLRDITVMQLVPLLDVGNDGDPNHILCQGQYLATVLGTHTLEANFKGANYWPNPDGSGGAQAFEMGTNIAAEFEVSDVVYLDGDLNKDRVVNLLDLAIYNSQYLLGPGVPSADIWPIGVGDGVVDLFDFAYLASFWMMSS